ncbi:MAG: TerC family protein [Firmicutes bacterium]|nr:TerC family protein [Bacillota bacterium]
MIPGEQLMWLIFAVVVIGALALDLGVVNRKAHEVTTRQAAYWVVFWVSLALAFGAGIYVLRGSEKALEFFAGYLIEESLSVDNLFVFLLIFNYFRVPGAYQHRVLFWGILGALVMRAFFIGVGVALFEAFHWVVYVFGAFLIFTGFKTGLQKEKGLEPETNPILRVARRLIPMAGDYHGERFFTRVGGRLLATPLLPVLLVVESSDLVFAVDSIPAIFGVTRDPFIVYTSNVFAIMGLRSLFFLLSNTLKLFRFLKQGLAVVLCFVGFKMLISGFLPIPIGISLGIIGMVLVVTAVASLVFPDRSATKTADSLHLTDRVDLK